MHLMTLSLLSLLRCCLFNSICVWVESLLSDVTWVYFFLLGLFSRPKPQPPISAHYNTVGHLFEASQRKYSLLLLRKIDLLPDETTESAIFRQSVVKKTKVEQNPCGWTTLFVGSKVVTLTVGLSFGLVDEALDLSLLWWVIYKWTTDGKRQTQ